MKKLIAIALLAFASSAVFAGGVSPAVRSNDVATVADASTSAAEAPVTAPAPSALEKGATKVGSVLGGMFRTTFKLGQAVGSGIRQGLSDKSALKSTDVSPTSQTSTQPAVSAPAATPAMVFTKATVFSNPVTHQLAALLQRTKDQMDAPVEDRSMLASTPN